MVVDRIYGAALFLVAALLFATTYSAEYHQQGGLFGDVNTVFVPRIFLIAWMLLAAIQCVGGFIRKDAEAYPAVQWTKLGTVSAIAVLVAFAMLGAGFLLATIPGFFLFTWAFGYRRPVILAAVSVIFPIAIWLLFINVFKLPLPHSPWFDSF